MNKTTAIIIVILVLVAGGVGYLLLNGDDPSTETTQATSNTSSQLSQTSDPKAVAENSYQEYSEGAVTDTEGTKILFFHANWCPQCKKLEADIKQTAIPAGITIFEVDYDNSQDLKQKYGVTLQTTLVRVDDNGELVSKYVAYNDPSWDAVANNLL